jgi:hypothetical protein
VMSGRITHRKFSSIRLRIEISKPPKPSSTWAATSSSRR